MRVGAAVAPDAASSAVPAPAASALAAALPAVTLPEGATVGEAARLLRGSDARVLRLDVSDLARLCRCLADAPELQPLNRKLQGALSQPYHYCDTTDNPYFVACKAISADLG